MAWRRVERRGIFGVGEGWRMEWGVGNWGDSESVWWLRDAVVDYSRVVYDDAVDCSVASELRTLWVPALM